MKRTTSRSALSAAIGLLLMLTACGDGDAQTQTDGEELTSLTIPVLAAPSLGFFLPPVIEDQGFDEQAGLDVDFVQKPAGTFRTDFAGGSDQVGGSGTLLADVGRVNQEGVETVYAFNVFDFWGGVVVPEEKDIASFEDLEGASLGAALPTANFAMLVGVLDALGVDQDSINQQNADVPGLGPLARSGRVDAVHMWEPAHTILLEDEEFSFTTLDITEAWREATGLDELPYLGVAVHREWLDENTETLQQVYDMYKAAADWVLENPAEASEVIGNEIDVEPGVIQALIESDRLGLNIYPAHERQEEIEVLLERAVETGYLDKVPDLDAILYDGLEG